MTLALNLLLLIIFLLFLYFIVKLDYKIVFLFGLLIFQAVTILPSLIYIEEGIFISEQGRESFFVGATFVYVVYFIITFLVIFITFNTLKKLKSVNPIFVINSKSKELSIVLFIVLSTLAILLYNASQSRLPFFDTEMTRFTYWENSKFPFLNKIFGNTSIFIPFSLGILFNKYKKTSVLLMIIYFGYNFLIGQKFSPIVSGIYSFLLPIILTSNLNFNLKKILTKKVILSFLLIFGTSYLVIYKIYEQRRPYAIIKIYDPNEAMFYRAFGLQGHLMWGAVETYVYNDEPHSYNPLDLSKGMQHLMYKFSNDKNRLEKAIEKGFNFTNGYPSILFLVFPVWLGLLVHIFLTITIISFLGWILYEFIKNKAFVMSVIAYQLFNWVIYAFTMGYFYKLKYAIIFLICYAIFVVLNNKIKLKQNNLKPAQ